MIDERFVLVTPVRDEERYLPGTIETVAAQTRTPIEWVIVDDGSRDRTADIVLEAARRHPWIRLVRKVNRGWRSVGPGVVEAFYAGYERILSPDYGFIGKMDGDIELPPRYFERLFEYFRRDPVLGAASGKIFARVEGGRLVEERMVDDIVVGALNFYRRDCFRDIGGFVREVHWDAIAFHRARMTGWRTRSIRDPELTFVEQRLMGSSDRSILLGRRRWGRGQYFIGTHPFFLLAIALYRMPERPFVLGGLGILIGYVQAWLDGMRRYPDRTFRRSLRAWQFERLGMGRRLETLPPPPRGLYP